ncbi:hypothetical protein [Limimaricola litoreus]|uniref:Uncharacterized protein n=1 Tax=Limimaricola litoreus TaxID=2955316 RepID=A0A9X2FRS7_9RHOB|nr:hypothetical protein [Limimaricola litoreus]MCP1166986.1 hypothetical protein [Limimaricola litoreus]
MTQEDLREALGKAMPPDFAAATVALSVGEDELRAALPAPEAQTAPAD